MIGVNVYYSEDVGFNSPMSYHRPCSSHKNESMVALLVFEKYCPEWGFLLVQVGACEGEYDFATLMLSTRVPLQRVGYFCS